MLYKWFIHSFIHTLSFNIMNITAKENEKITALAMLIYARDKGKTPADFDLAFNEALEMLDYDPTTYHLQAVVNFIL